MKKLLSFIFAVITPFMVTAQWTELTTNTTEALNDIFFVNENTGFCVGENGTILKTTNGGDLWTALNFDSNADFDSLYFKDENTGWVNGIYQTNDGGTTFFSLESLFGNTNPDKYLYHSQIMGYKDDIVILGGFFTDNNSPMDSHFIITSDGGNTWSTLLFPDGIIDYMSYIQIVNDSVFYLANFNIYKTTDGGTSWTQIEGINLPLPPHNHKCYKVFDVYGNGWASLTYHMDSVNIDSLPDESMDLIVSYPMFGIVSASFPTNDIGYFLQSFDLNLYKSTDHGYTFESLSTEGITDDMRNLYFVNEQTGFVCGYNGKIYKTTSGGLSVKEPEKHNLKIYPNPAKEKINLEYENGLSIQSIQLLDISGKVIKTYHSGFQEINIQGIEKGMYLLSIKTQKEVQTHKIVVK